MTLFTRASFLTVLAAALTFPALAASPAIAQKAPSATSAQDRGDSAGGATKLTPPTSGEQVYKQVCQACHMVDARGGSGAATIPALASNPRVGSDAYVVTMSVKGRGAMPGFTDLLPPAQIANVATYIRTHFGNAYPKPVTEAGVLQIEGANPAAH